MFESTGWVLEEPEVEDTSKYDLLAPSIVKPPKSESLTENMNEISEIGIVHQYQFSSSLQRMSVIVRVLGSGAFKAYTKGSPEMILSLSKPETIPKDITETLKTYTEQGYRVIAIGCTSLDCSYSKVSLNKLKVQISRLFYKIDYFYFYPFDIFRFNECLEN